MNIGLWNDDHLQPMRYFVDFSDASKKILSGTKGNRPVEAGQIVAFEGVNNYSEKYPYGSWKASNTICIQDTPGDQKFVSLGTGPAGKTEAEICQTLLNKYNQKEDPFLIAPEDDEIAKQLKKLAAIGGEEMEDSVREKLFPPARDVMGFNCESSEGFIIEVIRDLVQLPLEQVSMDFVKTHPMNINRFKDQ